MKKRIVRRVYYFKHYKFKIKDVIDDVEHKGVCMLLNAKGKWIVIPPGSTFKAIFGYYGGENLIFEELPL